MSLEDYNPSEVGLKNGRFMGLPFDIDKAKMCLLPVPWDVTVSYGAGTASGPKNILDASSQLDLHDPFLPEIWKEGIFMLPISKEWKSRSELLRAEAEEYITWLEHGSPSDQSTQMQNTLSRVNDACLSLKNWVNEKSEELLNQRKWVGIIGGDHSVPLGLIEALSKHYVSFGILQIDAHMDLRKAYEGFIYSHASIFHHVLKIPSIHPLVQVGIRDYCEEEVNRVKEMDTIVHTHFFSELAEQKFQGDTWQDICANIIHPLPNHVYISLDVDGLLPSLCPHTGTPVPGGLTFEEATYLIRTLVRSGRKIVGFDVSETGGIGNKWDGNVSARLLYQLSIWLMYSQS